MVPWMQARRLNQGFRVVIHVRLVMSSLTSIVRYSGVPDGLRAFQAIRRLGQAL